MKYRAPSMKTLTKYFPQVEKSDLLTIRKIIRDEISPMSVPATAKWYKSRFHGPTHFEIIMHSIDVLLGNFNVEVICGNKPSFNPLMEYSNNGETYDVTIIYDYVTDTFKVQSYGDWIEQYEKHHTKLK